MVMLRANYEESTFRWTITQFSDEYRKVSPEFVVQNFPFQLEMRKVRTIQENTLKMYLNRTNGLKDVELTCMVSVEFKLLSFDENVEPHCKSLVAAEYGPNGGAYSSVSLISLIDLSDPDKKFVRNDAIVLEIHVKADPPQNDTARLPRLQTLWNDDSAIKLHLTVKEIGQRIGIISPVFSLRDISWQLCVYRNDDTLDVRLRPVHRDLIKSAQRVSSTIKLLPFSPLHSAHERNYSGQIDGNDIVLVFKQFIQWNELVNPLKHFIRDGCIKLDIVFKANDAQQSVPSSQRLNDSGIGCPICLESLLDLMAVSLKCGHIYCKACVDNSIRAKKQCPICRTKVLASQIRPAYLPYAN
ncbi:uncharacterized protein LOC129575188 isoform X2 [Sitodiplosis mosellana]|uniref:uncharacterized protein LOC129575188 isoform X2 n=1 Tax=Sitodiplosis mosellana TaxID=263140 RepID=UPI0024447AEB|nr:uncharacterized protein LOC129575188 isoform X2 [Sitodiplosis mosellana]